MPTSTSPPLSYGAHGTRGGPPTAALQIATQQCTALKTTAYAAVPTLLLARLRLLEGRLGDAATEARAALARSDVLGAHLYDPFGTTVLAIVATRRGDLETAAGYADRATRPRRRGAGPCRRHSCGTFEPHLGCRGNVGLNRPSKLIDRARAGPARGGLTSPVPTGRMTYGVALIRL